MKNDRYELLFPTLQTILAQYQGRGVQLIWISYPTSIRAAALPNQQAQLITEAQRYGIDAALGLDPLPDSPAHNDYHATRGTCDFYLVDGDGNVAWRIIDPMFWDEGLLRAVAKRVYASADE